MGSRMKISQHYKGVPIYCAANTHPDAKTTSLAVFVDDIPGQASKVGIIRFRYTRLDGISFGKALTNARKYINEQMGQLG